MLRLPFLFAAALLLPAIASFAQPCTISTNPSPATICNGASITLTVANGTAPYTWTASSGGPISSTGNSITVTPSSTTTYSVTSSGGCSDNQTVTVLPINAAFSFSPNTTPCASTPFTFTNSSTGPGLTYSWNFGNTASGTSNTSTATNPSHTFVAPGNGNQSFTVTLTATSSNGCSDVATQTINVQQAPDPTIGDPVNPSEPFANCSGAVSFVQTIQNLSSTYGTNGNFTINWGDGSPVYTGPFTTDLTHNYNGLGYNTITITVTGGNGCTATTTQQVYNGSNPSVGLANPGGTVGLCGPATLTFPITNYTGNPPGTIYTVTSNDGSAPVSFTHPPPASVTHVFAQSSCGYTSAGGLSNAFHLRIEATNPCGTTLATIEPIRVGEKPVASMTVSPGPICVGQSYTFTNTSTGNFVNNAGNCIGPTPQWSITPSTGWAGGNPNTSPWTVTFNVSGIYTVKLKATNGCGVDSVTQQVCVLDPAQSNFSSSTIGCAPTTVSFTNLSNTLTQCGTTSYNWNVSPSSGWTFSGANTSSSTNTGVTFTQAGTYTMTLTVTSPCNTHTYSQTVVIKSPPTVTVSPLPSSCGGAGAAITPSASFGDGGGTITTYNWTFTGGLPTGSTNQNPGSITYASGGNFTVTASATNECGTTTDSETFSVYPTPNANAGNDATICQGASTTLNGSATSGSTPYSYSWSPTTALSNWNIANPIASPSSTTTYTLNVTDANGCTATDQVVVTVNPSPTLNVSGGPGVCIGGSISITASGTGITGYTWSPNTNLSATTGATVSASPTTTTTYTVVGTSGAGCGGTGTFVANIYPLPSVSVTAPTSVCIGNSITLTASGASTYSWTPSATLSASTGSSVTATPTVTTSYTVTGTSINGCTGSAPTSVTVTSLPNVTASTNASTICNGQSATLTANGATTYSWTPTTGLSSATGTPVTASPTVTTTYTVTGSLGANCNASATVVVNVNGLPSLNVTSPDADICVGQSASLSATGAASYTWTPNTGLTPTNAANVTANPTITTTYTITGTGANGCTGNTTTVVTVNPKPVLTINPTNPNICLGETTTITANGASTYTWSPSTGLSATTGTSVTASPTITTTYKLVGTTASGCKDSITFNVQVFALPNVTATSNDYSICNTSSATLTAIGAANFTWTPSNGLVQTTGATVSASPSATTTYTVIGTAGQGCSSQDTVVVNVLPLPSVSLSANTTDICIGDTATVVATASNIVSYTWNPNTNIQVISGNTMLSWVATTTTYTLTLVGTNGCSTIVNPVVAVHQYPIVTVAPSPLGVCLNGSGTATASGASTYEWSPNTDISSTTGASVSVSPAANSTYTVIGTSQYGCADTTTLEVTVNINVEGTSDDYQLCLGESANLTAINASSYNWSPSGGLSSTNGANIIASPSVSTTYTVTGFTSSGCQTTDTVVIIVHNLPVVTVDPPAVLQCSGTPINYVASGADTYTWSPSSGLSITTGANIVANPTQFLTYTVVGTDVNGCTGNATSIVQVYPLPPINAGLDQVWCHTPIDVTLSGFTPQGGIWTGPGITDSINAVFSPWTAGVDTHTIYYHVINANGCENHDSINVIVTPQTFPTAGNGDTACYMDAPFYLTGSTPAGGVWSGFGITNGNSGLFNPTLSGPGLHPVLYSIGQGQCTRSDTAYVLVKPAPALSINPVQPKVCIGDSVDITVSGALTYTWAPSPTLTIVNNTTANVQPNVTTTYTVMGTDAEGCSNSLQIQVIVNPLPAVTAGTNQTLCSFDDPSFIFNFSPFGGQWTGTGITNAFTGEFSPQVSGPGLFDIIYEVTDVNGCTNTDNMQITVVDPTTANAGNDLSTCVNATPFNLTGFTPANGTWSGSGITNSTTGTFNPMLAGVGTHKLIYTPPASLCILTDSIMVTVNAAPVLTLVIADNTLCSGQSTNISAGGGNTYTWTPSTGLNATTGDNVTASPLVTTTYTVVATDGNGCTNNANAVVVMNPLPILSINPSAPVICNGQTANLQASGASTYTWAPNTALNQTTGTAVTANPNTTTTYTITGTDVNGCVNTTTVTLTVNALPNITLSEDDPWICNNSNTSLYASGAQTYTWSPFSSLSASSGATLTANPTITTTYTVTGTDANGCQDDDTISVTVFPPPITFNQQPEICQWDSTSITAYNCMTYSWSPSVGLSQTSGATVVAHPTLTTTYTVIGTDDHGCTGSNTVTVTVHFPIINTFAYDDTLCDGENTTLIVNGAVSYAWTPTTGLSSTNNPTVVANPSTSTTYTMIGTDIYQCPDTVYYPVTVHPQPEAIFMYDKPSGCDSLPVQFTNLSTDAFIYKWTFSNGTTDSSTNPLHWFSGPGVYDVELYVEGLGGCRDSMFVGDAITVYPEPVADFAWVQSQYPVINGEVIFNNTSINADTYHWNFGDSTYSNVESPTHQYENYGTYLVTLVAMNEDGCVDTVTRPIEVIFFKGLYLPNAMTPNYGDAANRVFTPKGFNLKTYHIQIFDTWGNLLWESHELTEDGQPKESWDGYYKGELLQQDVYVWKCAATFLDNSKWDGQKYPSGEIKPTGTVTILR